MVSSYNIELSVRVVQVVSSSPDYSSLQPSLFISSSFPSDPPGWLVCCCATSVHSLQEMTDADEGRKTPFSAIKNDSA